MKKVLISLIVFQFLTACDAVFVENISDKKVVLVSPSDSVEVQAGFVNFHWNSIEDATDYRLQIAMPSFVDPSQIVLDTAIVDISFKDSLTIGDYQWRVKAVNSDYQTNYTTRTLIIK